ncbi:MAG TPA: ferritin family protein [Burkholderiales bacterium]|nr:ferritin family protein [Burkholderiales bacterium]
MDDVRTIRSVPELYAHALAIEREAAARYQEFATRMDDEGNDAAARLFRELAGFERQHAAQLERDTKGMLLPSPAPGDYAWLDSAAPETAAHDLLFRLMTPSDALEIALAAELRAQDFFEHVRAEASDARLRDLASEMAQEEQAHAAWVREALARTPDPRVDWDRVDA